LAAYRSSKTSSVDSAKERSGIVRKVAEATNASVPSLPTIRWVRISAGVAKSTSALMP